MEDGTTTLAAEMAAEVRQLADMIEANPEVAAPLVERTRVEEIVEWRCAPLTAPAGAAVTA